jgi:hypothetical protein
MATLNNTNADTKVLDHSFLLPPPSNPPSHCWFLCVIWCF